VAILCKEALLERPSCAPALECLAQHLFDMACLLRDAAAAAASEGAAAAAGVVGRARDAAGKSLRVLSEAAVADPMRRQYFLRRRDETQLLVGQLAAA
jgi:hypothetical protein